MQGCFVEDHTARALPLPLACGEPPSRWEGGGRLAATPLRRPQVRASVQLGNDAGM